MSAAITRHETAGRMSQIVRHNGTIWLAGQVGARGESVTAQTGACLAALDRLLGICGSDLLQVTIWLADMTDFAEMNAVWDAWVPDGAAPARACGEARLADPGYRVEIIAVAAEA